MKWNTKNITSSINNGKTKVKWNVSRKLLGGYLVMVILLVAVFVIASSGLRTMGDSGRAIIEETKQLNYVTEIRRLETEEWQLYTDYSLTNNEAMLIEARATNQKIITKAEALQSYLAAMNSTEATLALEQFLAAHQRFVEDNEAAIILTGSDQYTVITTSSTMINSAIANLESVVNESVQIALIEADKAHKSALIATTLLAIAALLVASGLGLFLSKHISSNVTNISRAMKQAATGDLTAEISIASSDELGEISLTYKKMVKDLCGLIGNVKCSSSNLTSASSQLANAAERAGSATKQIASVSHQLINGADEPIKDDEEGKEASTIAAQISSATQQVTSKAQVAASGTVRTAAITKSGMNTVDNTITGMRKITASMNDVVDNVERLVQHSEDLSDILDTIDNVVQQTKLIAKNAAREAARAGKNGEGFTVIASELKHLAEQTGREVKRISRNIDTVLKDINECTKTTKDGAKHVEEGYKLANETHTVLDRVMDAVEETSGQIDQVLAASEEITESSNDMINMIDNVVQEIASSSQLLSQISGELQNAIAMFKISKGDSNLSDTASIGIATDEKILVAK